MKLPLKSRFKKIKKFAMKNKHKNHKEHEGHHDHTEHHQMMAEDFKRRFLVVLPLTIIVLILSPKIQEWLGFSVDFAFRNFVLFVLGTAITAYGGKPFFEAAKNEIKSRNWGMMTLVSLALTAGYTFSIAATFLFPGESLWWEISTLVSVFLFGHWLEMRAVIGTGGALKELAALIPPMAHKVIWDKNEKKIGEEKVEDIPTDKLQKGDYVLVRPGEKIPIDGEIVQGESSVNEAMITGESKPVAKKEGDVVIGGSINNDGSLVVRVDKTGAETAVSQIMELIRQAQETKPKVQNLADKAANWLTIIAIVVGTGTFFYWLLINPQGAIFASTLAITVIVITCPHALGLAIPTVTTITTSLAAKNGILIRDMRGLEVAKNLDYVVFDKTGTLTKGQFGVAEVLAFKGLAEKDILKLAASVELHSQHSIAQGIVSEARERKIKFSAAHNFKSIPGKGAEGKVGKDIVILGNTAMLEKRGIELKVARELLKKIKDATRTVIWVARDNEVVGAISLEDEIRVESKKAINKLHEMGIKVAMLTGDKKEVADVVGKKLGIDTVFAEVLPEDKVNKVKYLQTKGFTVAMVGDGVNDAPSLTQAHLGIAVGAGTSVAIESAEIVLVKNDPRDVVKVISLSRKTDAKMKQNLAWATGYNL
ncbi:heavy metal translocating P-type ATPase, partial [Candidatus Woesebacteria bacterium]